MGGGGHADAASSRDVLKLVGGVLLTATLVMLIWVRSTPTFVDWTDDEGEFSVVYDAMRGDRISVDARSDDMAMDLEILIGDVIVEPSMRMLVSERSSTSKWRMLTASKSPFEGLVTGM